MEIVGNLLNAGADINARTEVGDTPLLLAISHSQPDILATLIDTGADVNLWNDAGVTPFQSAMEKGQKEVAERLSGCGRRSQHQAP